MRTLIAYFSKSGNTRRIAEVIADTMKQAAETRVVGIDQLTPSDFEGVDLVVMGTPTHAFSVPKAVRSVLDALPHGILAGKSVAVFDTTVKPWPLRHLRASPKLLARLSRLGGTPIAPPQTFFVKTTSPQQPAETDLLLQGQLDQARYWAAHTLSQRNT